MEKANKMDLRRLKSRKPFPFSGKLKERQKWSFVPEIAVRDITMRYSVATAQNGTFRVYDGHVSS